MNYDIPQLLDPEWINEFSIVVLDNFFPWVFEDWENVTIPKVMILEDLHHGEDEEGRNIYEKCFSERIGYDAIFTKYLDSFEENWSVDVPYFHLPHCISDELHKDYQLEKEYEFLMTGTISGCYELRDLVMESLDGKPYFWRIERRPNKEMAWPYGVDYCKELNKSLMSLGTTSTYKYPVAKFFEIPACHTALVGNYTPELGRLGFKPNENYIHIEIDSDIAKIVEHYLDDYEKLIEITENGYKMVHKKHNTEQRTKEFISYCEEIIRR